LKLQRLEPGVRKLRSDQVAVEEPLEIRVEFLAGGSRETRSVSVTMRTPGHDFELAAGFLFSESILSSRGQVREISYCQADAPQEYNVLSVRLRDNVVFDPTLLTRNFYTSSSCGVCGKASIEAVEVKGCPILPSGTLAMEGHLVTSLPDLLLEGQAAFQRTGGLHAAGLFDSQGSLEVLREDVGRHNAVDKVVGHGFLEGAPPRHDRALVVSGRTSFEIIQKALMAGIPMVVAVGAPSSLAVDLARSFNMTLVGFARGSGFNLYTGEERVLDWKAEGR
jgi:FdhD protein